MKNAIGIFVVLALLTAPLTLAAADETFESNALLIGKSASFSAPSPSVNTTCGGAMDQLEAEATDLFGFNPGSPTEIIEDRVMVDGQEVPFGIVVKFANSSFGYGRALPLNEFTHVRAIVVHRNEPNYTKMSGIVYNQEVENPSPELLIGHLFAAPEVWDADALENGVWDFNWTAQNTFWTGTYGTYSATNWDCNAGE